MFWFGALRQRLRLRDSEVCCEGGSEGGRFLVGNRKQVTKALIAPKDFKF